MTTKKWPRPANRKTDRTGRKRTYTDRDRAAVYAVWEFTGRNMAQTSRLTGVPQRTICDWVASTPPQLADIRGEMVGRLAARLDTYVTKLLQIDPERTEGLTLGQIGQTLGVALDKLIHLVSLPVLRAAKETRSQLDLTRLTPDQLSMFASLTMKAYGRPEAPEANDLNRPVIMDPSHPNGWYTLDLDAAPAEPPQAETPEPSPPPAGG
jgi:hypothetical protein